jgi:hypothetical protein
MQVHFYENSTTLAAVDPKLFPQVHPDSLAGAHPSPAPAVSTSLYSVLSLSDLSIVRFVFDLLSDKIDNPANILRKPSRTPPP